MTLNEWQETTGTVRFVPPNIEKEMSANTRLLVLAEAFAQSRAFRVSVVNVYRGDVFGDLCFGHSKNGWGGKVKARAMATGAAS